MCTAPERSTPKQNLASSVAVLKTKPMSIFFSPLVIYSSKNEDIEDEQGAANGNGDAEGSRISAVARDGLEAGHGVCLVAAGEQARGSGRRRHDAHARRQHGLAAGHQRRIVTAPPRPRRAQVAVKVNN